MRTMMLALLSTGLVLGAAPALAAPTKTTTTRTVVPAKGMVSKTTTTTRPLSGAAATAHAKKVAMTHVTTKTTTGKTVRYDCSKAGNKNKKACGK